MAIPAACRANVPLNCPFHGNVIRMHEAQAAGDYNAYYVARQLVEAAEKNEWNEDDYVNSVASGKPIIPVVKTRKKRVAKAKVVPIVRATSADKGAQEGVVYDELDVIDPEYPNSPITFYRRKDGVSGLEPDHIRIQANRKLNDEDVKTMASLLGYKYSTTVAGERLGWPKRDTPYSFVVFADMSKTRRDDLGEAMGELEKEFPESLDGGSPILKRGSKGKVAGERAIDGFGEKDLRVEIYYDSVTKDNA